MKPRDIELCKKLQSSLQRYERDHGPLKGIADEASRQTLLRQIIDSVHRVRYPIVIRSRKLSDQVANTDSIAFDPIKAAALFYQAGKVDEACWLVFLFVHFGKHARGGWRFLKEVYAGEGSGHRWTWAETSTDVEGFRRWLRENSARILRRPPPGGFGNHRKYESLDADKANGTAAVVRSYVQWVSPPRLHEELFAAAIEVSGGDKSIAFDALYHSMDAVHRFGRTARFDYLTMLGKLGIVDIEPGMAYLSEATGPKSGAALLFAADLNAEVSARELENGLRQLDAYLCVGMQVLEDSLCNWQKSPRKYKPFRA